MKNCILNDMGNLFTYRLNGKLNQLKEGTAAEIVQKHYDSRHYLSERGFEKWADFKELYIDVTDILNGSRIDIRREEVPNPTTDWFTNITESYATKIVADIKFNLFIEGISHLFMKAYLFPDGFNGKPIPLKYKIDNSYKPEEAPKNKQTINKQTINKHIIIDVPEKYEKHEYPYGFVLFMYRVDLFNNGRYVHPIDKNEKIRYVGARCNINNSSSTIFTGMGSVRSPDYEALNMLFGNHVRIGEIDDLLSYKTL